MRSKIAFLRDPAREAAVAANLRLAYDAAVAAGLSVPAYDRLAFRLSSHGSSRGGRFSWGYGVQIATWAFDREAIDPGYLRYLVAHEFSHVVQAFVANRCDHGPGFMRILAAVCPRELQHFEGEYKPRMAKACGLPVRNREWTIIVVVVLPATGMTMDVKATVSAPKLTRARMMTAARKAAESVHPRATWCRASIER